MEVPILVVVALILVAAIPWAIRNGPSDDDVGARLVSVNTEREPLLTDLLIMFTGVGAIAIAILRLGNNIDYLPTDSRSQAWFDPLTSSIGALIGLFAFSVGSIRLIQALRERNKHG